jgi:alanine dehydrogenase
MLIGVPKEIKNHEYRIGMVPASVLELTSRGHKVVVEANGGAGIGFSDADYQAAGATIAATAAEIFAAADMIVKVKEPQAVERKMLRQGQLLFTYLHLAPDPEQTDDLQASGATCIAYETVTSARGGLPLLAPMSEVAGRMSIQAGAACLEKSKEGCGMLLGGVPGVEPAKVTIIGGGVVGSNAARMAIGMGAQVVILDRSVDALRRLVSEFGTAIQTVYSRKLVTADMVSRMKPGSAIVDVAIDQGGCFETSHATTHQDPTYIVDDVVHYCVANMPGAVARTSTLALNNATLPYIVSLADLGWEDAIQRDEHLANGLNVHAGKITSEEVAVALGREFTPYNPANV